MFTVDLPNDVQGFGPLQVTIRKLWDFKLLKLVKIGMLTNMKSFSVAM